MAFTTLPKETLEQIMSHLDYRSLLRFGSACRLLYEIRKASPELQCFVELSMDGLQMPLVTSSTSHAELLSRLRDLRISWAGLDWKRFTEIEIQNEQFTMVCELAGGDSRTIEHSSLGFPIQDFAIDPAQDLIIIFEGDGSLYSLARLHIRTISTNESHPNASQGILEFSTGISIGTISRTAVAIAMDVVALYIYDFRYTFRPRLLIWNWKNGILIQDLDFMISNYYFSLLNRDSFAITSDYQGGAIMVYSFDPCATGPSPYCLCAVLNLPELALNITVAQLSIQSESISSGYPEVSTFSSSPESQLLMLCLEYHISEDWDTPVRSSYHCLFVYKRTLLDYVDRFRREEELKGAGNAQSLEVDWGSWGEMNTRLINRIFPPLWVRSVHGQRAIFNFQDDQSIDVLNFNLTSSALVSDEVSNLELHDEPSSFKSPLFRNVVCTRLPYYSTTRTVNENFNFCMIDEERIVGMETKSPTLYVYGF
ncbi:hypothetical protein CPB84DRAFT_1851749 [Gymnopilus junonius]|uniref:F-box domain-containing protein n=1 Tax=Gymnopilus junonius TaxID=109634 RepID=A0A9P5NFQ8_GYMJU|nr:hypothetical protein CPB84DRAFT_1851749 [Gymnopilus junonius]